MYKLVREVINISPLEILDIDVANWAKAEHIDYDLITEGLIIKPLLIQDILASLGRRRCKGTPTEHAQIMVTHSCLEGYQVEVAWVEWED